MSNIRLSLLSKDICTGKHISFIAPCNCSEVDYLQILGNEYEIVDSIGRVVTGKTGAWTQGAMVSVILNCEEGRAYIQNCAIPEHDHELATATKSGLMSPEDKVKLDGFKGDENYVSTSGGTMKGTITLNGIILTEGIDYGDTLPDPENGKLFFLKA